VVEILVMLVSPVSCQSLEQITNVNVRHPLKHHAKNHAQASRPIDDFVISRRPLGDYVPVSV
jgi:hypothetical protein